MSKRLDKISQLDSIRCFAAFGVILFHYLRLVNISFPLGAYGVDMFFAISGFLVTSILLEQKQLFSKNKLLIVKNFVIKRALRIFPIYYLVLFFWSMIALLFNVHIWDKGEGVYYYTYTSNILFFLKGIKGVAAHTWTLAVEEQFYLFWPWLILFVKKQKEYLYIIPLIVFSLYFKSGFLSLTNTRYLTISHFDTLGIGALLAVCLKYNNFQIVNNIYKYKAIILTLSGAFIFASPFVLFPQVFFNILILIFSSTIIVGTYFGFEGVVGKILNNPTIQYLGRISYGLYLYHTFLPFLLYLVGQKLHFSMPDGPIKLFLSLSLTIIVAHLSYKYIETRFIAAKKKFDL